MAWGGFRRTIEEVPEEQHLVSGAAVAGEAGRVMFEPESQEKVFVAAGSWCD